MSSTWQNLIIQLGISSLVLFVVYQVGLRVIAAWRESEKERTAQTRESEKERNAAIAEGFKADMAAHQQIVTSHQSLVTVVEQMMRWCVRIESKIDAAFDLTPRPHTIPPMNTSSSRTVIVDQSLGDDEQTPDHRPAPTATIPKRTPTPPQGSGVVQGRGLYGAGKRPKTHG